MTGGGAEIIAATANGATGGFSWYANGPYMLVGQGCSGSVGSTIPSSTWVMTTMAYDAGAGTINFYLNDTNVGSLSGCTANAGAISFGVNSYDGSNPFVGAMDELFMFNRTLNATDITSLYNGYAGTRCVDMLPGAPPVSNGTSTACNITVWYPDKSVFINATNSTAAPSENQYIDFTVPNSTGIYEYQAVCTLAGNKTGVISKSFHVSEFQNDTSTKLNRIRAVMPK